MDTKAIDRLNQWAKAKDTIRGWTITGTGVWLQLSVSERGRYYSRRVLVQQLESAKLDLLDFEAETTIGMLADDLKTGSVPREPGGIVKDIPE